MTRPGSIQNLRIGLAKLLHKLPSEIDAMEWEDVLRVAVHCELEQERIKRDAPSSGGSRTEVVKEIHFGKPKAKKKR